MSEITVHSIDLNFQGLSGAIGVYLIPHHNGAVLVECGPESTLEALKAGLAQHGYSITDITDVLVTHIHLDHAGAAGVFARHGARIHVHNLGAPHLLNPEKLLTSAARIYGEYMDSLWGEVLPVPESHLFPLEDGEIIKVGNLQFVALETPGHAIHHMAYLLEDVCFTGDIGGVRLGGLRHLRLPMPAPDLNLEQWRDSLHKLQEAFASEKTRRVVPTHFGVYTDPDWHLAAIDQDLDAVDQWVEKIMPTNPSIGDLRQEYISWTNNYSLQKGLEPTLLDVEEAANPSFISADGIYRYWHKFRAKDL